MKGNSKDKIKFKDDNETNRLAISEAIKTAKEYSEIMFFMINIFIMENITTGSQIPMKLNVK